MVRMKSTGIEGQPRPPSDPPRPADMAAKEEDVDKDLRTRTYEKKGKRRLLQAEVRSASKKLRKNSGPTLGEGGSQKKRNKTKLATPLWCMSDSPGRQKVGSEAKKAWEPTASEFDAEDANNASKSAEALDDDSVADICVTTPSSKKKGSSSARKFLEEECRKQLNLLSQASKRPPTAMSEDIFATACQLGQDGLNPHRLRMEKDVSLADVEALFGEEKGRNGFLIAEKLTPTLCKEVESLYCQCY